jgi:hypothetical protein
VVAVAPEVTAVAAVVVQVVLDHLLHRLYLLILMQ